MTLDYFTLLSEEPVKIQNVGSIKSPTINEIKKITYSIYQTYIDYLIMDIPSYFLMMKNMMENIPDNQEMLDIINQLENDYDSFSDEEKNKLSILDVARNDENFIQVLSLALNFFFTEDVEFNQENSCFYLYDRTIDNEDEIPTGIIHSGNYNSIIDLILSRVNIKRKSNKDEKIKFKNKKAAELYAKMQKGKNKKKENESDKRFELANIISSLAVHSKNLNIIDIGKLTVFQLYDQFQKQQIEDLYELTKRSVSIWGDTDNKFDVLGWLKLNNDD